MPPSVRISLSAPSLRTSTGMSPCIINTASPARRFRSDTIVRKLWAEHSSRLSGSVLCRRRQVDGALAAHTKDDAPSPPQPGRPRADRPTHNQPPPDPLHRSGTFGRARSPYKRASANRSASGEPEAHTCFRLVVRHYTTLEHRRRLLLESRGDVARSTCRCGLDTFHQSHKSPSSH